MYSKFTDSDKLDFYRKHYIHAFYCDLKKAVYHNHDFFELVYVISGKAVHKIDNDVREIAVGDYMFMDYSTYHEYTAATDDFAVINCLFLSKGIDKTMPDCRDFNQLLKSYHLRLNKIIMQGAAVNRFFHDDDQSVYSALVKMCNEREALKTGYIDYMRSLLIQIIIETVRKTSVEVEENYSSAVAKTVKIIEDGYSSKLQLSDIATELFISVPYLSSKFKEETGVCFSDYLKQVRIQKACMMLNTCDMKIHDIAEKCGYSDYKRFGNVFREITGTSPGKFRAASRI